jgi:hypothetical protein
MRCPQCAASLSALSAPCVLLGGHTCAACGERLQVRSWPFVVASITLLLALPAALRNGLPHPAVAELPWWVGAIAVFLFVFLAGSVLALLGVVAVRRPGIMGRPLLLLAVTLGVIAGTAIALLGIVA